MTEASSIKRASTQIDPEAFNALVELSVDQPWLQKRSNQLIELWNLCDQKAQQDLIVELLHNFLFVDTGKLEDLAAAAAKHITKEWQLTSKNAKFVAISDNAESDGSQTFLHLMKNQFPVGAAWEERHFKNRLSEGIARLKDGLNIVLLDDFIGTGNTIERRVNWVKETIKKRGKDVRVKVVAIAGMEQSKVVLDNLDIDYFCSIWCKKGISDFNDPDATKIKIQLMQGIESKLSRMHNRQPLPSLGFKKSEALYSLAAFNVPNNVFPAFWWPRLKDNSERNPLFRRLR